MATKKKKPGRPKKTSKKTSKKSSVKKDKDVIRAKSSSFAGINTSNFPDWLNAKNIILVLVIVVIVVFWNFRTYFFVASVNGQPVSRYEITGQLMRRFGRQVLENIINEKLIVDAAREKGVFVSEEEIDAETKLIEEKLIGEMTLEEALKVQGLTPDEFRRQLEIQLSIDKLFAEEATVSASEIDEYYDENRNLYKEATDPAKVREDIKELIKRQKIKELFDKWFSEVRNNANINIFLNP